MFPNYTGKIDFKQGTVTCNGEVRVYRDHEEYVRNDIRNIFFEAMDNRDKTSDIEGLPGSKPYFLDDWFFDYPAQERIDGAYPYELGYRSDEEIDGS